jgi:uncharacterized membrane protein YjfL (UPF0719 family)
MCAAVIAFQQTAQHSSALSDAGNWAAITAAVILVLGGIFGCSTALATRFTSSWKR